MRGLVFKEFLEFVDQTAGPVMTEKMLMQCDLESGGAYTSVGNYDHEEILEMVTFLNQATGNDVAEMVKAFGEHLFGQLAESHASIIGDTGKLLDFLEGIEAHIHKEVRKLYPDAELPYFESDRKSPSHLILDYESERPFADLAHGMICGAQAHFNTNLSIDRSQFNDLGKSKTRFDLRVA